MATKLLIGVLAFAGGAVVGALVCKHIAQQKVQGGLDSALASIGLGGGKIQSFTDSFVVPGLTN